MATAYADRAHEPLSDNDGIATAEDDQAVDTGRCAESQWGIVLDEVVPAVRRDAEADRRVGLVLRDLDGCLLYTSPSPRDRQKSRMPSSA